jgi:threonine dehydratase
VVGVQAATAACYALSLAAGRLVSTETCDTIADGVATRIPDPDAFEIIRRGAERVVTVTEDEIAEAMRAFYTDTHNLAEGAGAAPLAALLKEREAMAGRKIGLILTGGNVDLALFARLMTAS